METLRLEHVTKVYEGLKRKDGNVLAVSDFNLTVDDNEFIVFVGPSGCGKSTTLRMIAGLEEISSGNLYIDGQLMNKVEPNYRNIAMVFQNYALYPHMTAYNIMAFGLKNRHVPKAEIDRRIHEAAKILDIEELLNRKPKAMSGGQRQRIALGRAIVQTPKIFLLDEPLSNLDAKLRAQMRVEINKLYEKLQTTFIYVTHDQVEAMTMGTRIVVMKKGFVQQIDTPTTLYDFPKNRFVAGFLGTPQMNFYECTLTRVGEEVKISLCGHDLNFKLNDLREIYSDYLDGETHKIILGIRPDDLTITNGEDGLDVKINILEALGNESLIYADFDLNSEVGIHESTTSVVLKTAERMSVRSGDIIKLKLNPRKIHLFMDDDKDEKAIMLSPRTNRNELRAFIENKGDGNYRFTFDSLLFIDTKFEKEVHELYKENLHKVRIKLNDGVKLDKDGSITLTYQGKGIIDNEIVSRFEIDPSIDYDKSFFDSTTHIYLKTKKKFELGEKVNASFDFDKIEIIGDDKVSIFDLNEKEKVIDDYQIRQVTEEELEAQRIAEEKEKARIEKAIKGKKSIWQMFLNLFKKKEKKTKESSTEVTENKEEKVSENSDETKVDKE